MDGTTFQPLVAVAGGAFDQYSSVLSLLQGTFAAHNGIIDPPSSVTRLTLEQVESDARAGTLLTAEAEDEEIIGCMFAKTETDDQGDFLYLYHIAVAPLWQGKGIGAMMLSTVETIAKGHEIPRMQLMSRIELDGNHAFFQRHGFVELGSFTHEGFDHPTSLRFEKPITL